MSDNPNDKTFELPPPGDAPPAPGRRVARRAGGVMVQKLVREVKAEANPAIVAELKDLLKRAQAGELTSLIVYAGVRGQEHPLAAWVRSDDTNYAAFAGMMARMQARLLRAWEDSSGEPEWEEY
jgi:hypothetical protein